MPGAPYNETHWKNDAWLAIVKEAFGTVDEAAKRNELIAQAQEIEYNEGGYIIWAFRNQVDAYSDKIVRHHAGQAGLPARPVELPERLLRVTRRTAISPPAGAPFCGAPAGGH